MPAKKLASPDCHSLDDDALLSLLNAAWTEYRRRRDDLVWLPRVEKSHFDREEYLKKLARWAATELDRQDFFQELASWAAKEAGRGKESDDQEPAYNVQMIRDYLAQLYLELRRSVKGDLDRWTTTDLQELTDKYGCRLLENAPVFVKGASWVSDEMVNAFQRGWVELWQKEMESVDSVREKFRMPTRQGSENEPQEIRVVEILKGPALEGFESPNPLLETTAVKTALGPERNSSPSSETSSDPVAGQSNQDPAVKQIADVWPRLPEHIKRAIVTLTLPE